MGKRIRGLTALARAASSGGGLCVLIACGSPDQRTPSPLSAGAPAGGTAEHTAQSGAAGVMSEFSGGTGGMPEVSGGTGGMPEVTGGTGGVPEVSAGAAGGETSITISYRRDIQPIWNEYCTRCHGIQSPKLEAPDSRNNLDASSRFPECRNAPFVVPGEPDKSFLYFKLTRMTDVPLDPACERWMPADWGGMRDVPLIEIDPDAVARVRQWILEGARAD